MTASSIESALLGRASMDTELGLGCSGDTTREVGLEKFLLDTSLSELGALKGPDKRFSRVLLRFDFSSGGSGEIPDDLLDLLELVFNCGLRWVITGAGAQSTSSSTTTFS